MTLDQLIEAGRYEEACALLEPHSAGGDSSASSNIAIMHRRRGDAGKELLYAQRAYGQDPRSGSAINTLMRAYRSHNFQRAVAELYLACSDVASLDRIHHLWGAHALMVINRLGPAKAALARAPEFPRDEAYDLKLRLVLAIAEQDYDTALDIVTRIEAVAGPQDDERVSILFSAGRMREAVYLFEQKAPIDPAVAAQVKPALLAALTIEDRDAVQRLMARSAGLSRGLIGVAHAFLNGVTEVAIRGDRGTYRFPFSATNLSISLPHASGNFYERQTLDRLRTLLSPGDVVIDVGANIGNHSLYFAAEAGCRVRSFECNPRLIPLLQRAVATSGAADRIDLSLLGAAVSDHVGRVSFNFHRDDFSNVSSDLAEGDEGVPSLSLDSLNLERCDLLKIDVDGGEMAVLEGAAQTLERLRPTLAIEVLNTNMDRVLPWLAARDYVALREDTTGAAYSDFIMVHRTSRFRSV